VNTTGTPPPGVKEIEDAAAKVHDHVRQAVALAWLGDYRRARDAAGQAQGAARHLKELLGRPGTR
jgi:hypothetical protein